MDRIRGVFHGSTAFVREGFGSFHSRAVVMGGSAILLAAETLKQAVRAAAARRLGCEPGMVDLAEASIAAAPNGRSISFAELAGEGISAEESFANSRHAYSYGAHAAHVAVDPRTGQVEVVEYVAVEDVGRIINPILLKGQIVGAVVQGLGGALLEHLVYNDEGQLLIRLARRLSTADRRRFSTHPGCRHRDAPFADQPARRQGSRRRRCCSGRRGDRQRSRLGVSFAQCAAARAAARAVADLATHRDRTRGA